MYIIDITHVFKLVHKIAVTDGPTGRENKKIISDSLHSVERYDLSVTGRREHCLVKPACPVGSLQKKSPYLHKNTYIFWTI